MTSQSSSAGVGILVDYHTHPDRLQEAVPLEQQREHYVASMREYAERAVALGLAELGFSEHIYRLSLAPGVVPWSTIAARGDIAAYVEAVLAVRAAFSGATAPLVIRLAMEVDIVPATVSLLQAALPLYPFDYILGSVHRIPDLAEEADPEATYAAFYGAMQWAAESGLFQSIAHPDRMHRKLKPVAPAFLEAQMAEAAATLARQNVCAEVSGYGIRSAHTGMDPNPAFLRLCFEHGVCITLGSDAHRVEVVGGGLPGARDLAWQAGYREVATYDGGQRHLRLLQPPEMA